MQGQCQILTGNVNYLKREVKLAQGLSECTHTDIGMQYFYFWSQNRLFLAPKRFTQLTYVQDSLNLLYKICVDLLIYVHIKI